jgi:hypothetical protein
MAELYLAGDTIDSRSRHQLHAVEIVTRSERIRRITGPLLGSRWGGYGQAEEEWKPTLKRKRHGSECSAGFPSSP